MKTKFENPWKDSRLAKPDCNSAKLYPVKFRLIDDHVCDGYATWMPKDGYTDGDWVDVMFPNGNVQSDVEVLFWHDFIPFSFEL